MAADIARVSYDPTRQYRSLVAQQGRVTLEADNNEATTLQAEALRLETIDIVGPAGTPDNGYAVSSGSGPGGVTVGPGIFYLGGWRLELDSAVDLSKQPDWVDAAPFTIAQGALTVSLLVTEQSVCAAEDQALREVALGGPDSAARTRLMQRFRRIETDGTTCPEGAKSVLKLLEEDGVTVDAYSLQLMSSARLQAGFVPGPSSTDPCQPAAVGGYLGADNQLVRVTVTNYDPTSKTGKLLWGWNNASLLYRADMTSASDPLTLTLTTVPVDQEHAPQNKQMVEVLRTTTELGDNNFIADGEGFVVAVAQAWSPETGEIVLANPLPAAYQNNTDPLFVRLWQAEVNFEAGKPVALDTTSGITVAITMVALPSHIAAHPFWRFAVRPAMPQAIFPQRYQDAPQPPDGPRQWITDLAVVSAQKQGSTLLANCRISFLPLTKQHDCSCCSLVLDPDPEKKWIMTLKEAAASTTITALHVCFMPGTFKVADKITISGKSVVMTGAGAGTRIIGESLEAVFEFDNCVAVRLADLCIGAGTAGYPPQANMADLQGAVTIRNCNQVDIERVALACADADLRSASCLAIYNPNPPKSAEPQRYPMAQQYNARILDSHFEVGNSQVGILVVNADRVQIEGNVVVNPLRPRNINLSNLTQHVQVAYKMVKQLVHEMTLTDTKPPATRRARAKLRKRQAAANTPPAATPPAQPAAINFGAIGRAHIKASFGTFRLQFASSEKLTDAWTKALGTSSLTQNSTMGQIREVVKGIARQAVLKPGTLSPAFSNFIGALLPQLFSTSSQGIVVGGNLANDVRILDNTIDGTAQGIHVGLSNIKEFGKHPPHLVATRVQIRGNTVNVRVTAETTGDRHGIYVGCVTSAVISDNHLQLSRVPSLQAAWWSIAAIEVAGVFGPLVLIEGNCMQGFTTGINFVQDPSRVVPLALWEAVNNVSDAQNQIGGMSTVPTNVS